MKGRMGVMDRKMKHVRVGTRMRPELRTRLAGFASASGVPESAIIASSLEQYLDRTSDRELLMGRLNRVENVLTRIHRDQQLLAQAFSVFVRLWFAHTRPVADDEKAHARATAEARYKRFLQHVIEEFARGRRLVDDLPREVIADDGELQQVLEQVARREEPRRTDIADHAAEPVVPIELHGGLREASGSR